jgi:hypothetical protein
VVAMMIAAAMHTVIHLVGISEAMGCIAAMAESHDRRRRHEAKCGENGDHHRHAEAKPGAQLLQHRRSELPQVESCKSYESGKSLGDDVRYGS